jgi:predicted DNA binding CopG/RHH family protein
MAKKKKTGPKKVPRLTTDEEAEAFLAQDLSGLDFSQFKPVHFEFLPKDKNLNLRLPETLLDAVRKKAKKKGLPYQKYIRQVLEESLLS